jgi:hypothetical protein
MTLRARALIGTFIVASAAFGCGRSIDVGAVRGALPPDSRQAFDLVVVLQRLEGGGETDWARGEQVCRALKWPRCDRPALEEMQRRSQLPGSVRKDPVGAAALAVADLTWAYGTEDAARKMFRSELDRIPESDGLGRARVFVRFGVIDSNFDGQAALFAQACVADPNVCDVDRLKQAAQREVQARFVAPGNVVPLYFGGHPKIPGRN